MKKKDEKKEFSSEKCHDNHIMLHVKVLTMPKRVSTICLFADDSLLYQTVKSYSDAGSLHSDLDQLMSWANRWQMRFNPSKCSILRVSRKKQQIIHTQ